MKVQTINQTSRIPRYVKSTIAAIRSDASFFIKSSCISIVASPSLGPPSFPSLTLRIQFSNSHNSLTLTNPDHNLMFFVNRNTLQSFQILENLNVANKYLLLYPSGSLTNTCPKSPLNTTTLPPTLNSDGYRSDNEWHHINFCLKLQSNACVSMGLHPIY